MFTNVVKSNTNVTNKMVIYINVNETIHTLHYLIRFIDYEYNSDVSHWYDYGIKIKQMRVARSDILKLW